MEKLVEQEGRNSPVNGAKRGVCFKGYPVLVFKEYKLLSVVLYANALAVALPKLFWSLAPASVTVSYFRLKIYALEETPPCSAKRELLGL